MLSFRIATHRGANPHVGTMLNEYQGLDTPPSSPTDDWWEDEFPVEDEDADFVLEDDYSEGDYE